MISQTQNQILPGAVLGLGLGLGLSVCLSACVCVCVCVYTRAVCFSHLDVVIPRVERATVVGGALVALAAAVVPWIVHEEMSIMLQG